MSRIIGSRWKPALIKAASGNCNELHSLNVRLPSFTCLGAGSDQTMIFFSHLGRLYPLAEPFDAIDGLVEDANDELFGDTVCTHDQDELAVEESWLVLC